MRFTSHTTTKIDSLDNGRGREAEGRQARRRAGEGTSSAILRRVTLAICVELKVGRKKALWLHNGIELWRSLFPVKKAQL